MRKTIQGELSYALKKIFQVDIYPDGASRTDRGVHAHCQIACFTPPKECSNLQYRLNSLLPKSIRVLEAKKLSFPFHPTLDAKGKIYAYKIYQHEVLCPFKRRYYWHIKEHLNLELMQEGSKLLLGQKDFKGFMNACEKTETLRTLHAIKITRTENTLTFLIDGNNFLYKMVRNIVGSLVHIGAKKRS